MVTKNADLALVGERHPRLAVHASLQGGFEIRWLDDAGRLIDVARGFATIREADEMAAKLRTWTVA